MSGRVTPQEHCADFLDANADRDVRKLAHDFSCPPLAQLCGSSADDAVHVRRLTVSLATARSSFDIWSSLARLDVLLSDYRRLAPRFSFAQLTGEPSVAAGNEYRLTVTDPAQLRRIGAACAELAGGNRADALAGARRKDIRVTRAGPWGGETGEMVVEALVNHAVAGMASLWILIHEDGPDGLMRLRLDLCEAVRWAWAPDRQAAGDGGVGILDWPYLFERLAEWLDGAPVATDDNASFVRTASMAVLEEDERIMEALAFHPALAPLFGR